MCSSSLLIICPDLFKHFNVIFLDAWVNLVVPLTHSFLILSFFVIPTIHLNVLISFISILVLASMLLFRSLLRAALMVRLLFYRSSHSTSLVAQHSIVFLPIFPRYTPRVCAINDALHSHVNSVYQHIIITANAEVFCLPRWKSLTNSWNDFEEFLRYDCVFPKSADCSDGKHVHVRPELVGLWITSLVHVSGMSTQMHNAN